MQRLPLSMTSPAPDVRPAPPAAGAALFGLFSAAGAPLFLVGGWTWAAALQMAPFDPITETISALAAVEADARWVMTAALYAVGACHVITAVSLRAARLPGRLLQVFGGLCTMLVAATPLSQRTSPGFHMLFATAALGSLAVWPALAMRRDAGAPVLLRPAAALGAAALMIAPLVWLAVQISLRTHVGLAERVAAAAQALWPLAVVISSRRRAVR